MKTRNAILAAAIALCAASANALLVRTSDTTTLDTTSGLEWLRFAPAGTLAIGDIGPSFAEVRAGTFPGGPYAGWHIASSAEVHGLITDPQIGLPIAMRDDSGNGIDALRRFDQYIGFNWPNGFSALIADDIPDFPGYHPLYGGFLRADIGSIIFTEFNPCGGIEIPGGYYSNCYEQAMGLNESFNSTFYEPIGVFLARPYVSSPPGSGGPVAAIPEPESWAMMLGGLALMGLGWVGRRK